MSLLRVEDLSVQFHDKDRRQEAVSHLSFEVCPGEIVGIVGESGSGKSTGMHAVLGLLPEKAEVACERILLDQREITPPDLKLADRKAVKAYERTMEAVRGNEIAMVFQDPLTYLNPTVKIGRQITETIRAHKKCSQKEALEHAEELLDLVGIRKASQRMRQYPFELSGGMRQRVVIAIALACEPKLLIADEPTTALDVTVQGQILELFKKISQEMGTAILFVSHDLGVIASLCRRVLVMQAGKLVEEGTVEDIFYEPRHPYTRKLLAQASKLQKLPENVKAGEPLLRIEHVSKFYTDIGYWKKQEKTEAVLDVSLQIGRGETYGLVGESGCGKSTLAKMVTGLLKPTAGRIVYEGEKKRLKYPIQMVFQDPYASLNPRMTIGDILEEPLLLNTEDSKEERLRKIEELLKLVGLTLEDAQKYPRAFSGGQRQRIGIARALILEPELLICDEPVSALDVSIQEQILSLLENIQKERGISYLFISHDLNVVKRISRKMGVMYAGSLVETGSTKEIYSDPWHPYTKALLSAVLVPDPWKARRKKGVLHTEEKKVEVPLGRGCPFAPRCGYAMACCFTGRPDWYQFEGRKIACFLYSEEHAGRRSGSMKMTSQI
ncbi:ABC transporter ATP-binding protein [Faecalicatena sp. AGMB00832]|uniref:ABC transporter ATP-binding protein n=1 Tax=Faecalicatena faecalis TaxID=2726362 RepID=A0ABS6D345_9FIRM|nr:ABC transporter ATP-binding protein [Faecalicatena faecalis]MBU3876022.1 ABC transporter ATP-binding protein [Faecalicatena faecalis]